jgi:hypothetical protein
MTEKLNIVLHLEGEPYLVIETNLNCRPTTEAGIYAQVWRLPEDTETFKPNKHLKTYYGRHALTDAVLYLSELLQEPIAHKLRRSA